jgi:hypothetical protein
MSDGGETCEEWMARHTLTGDLVQQQGHVNEQGHVFASGGHSNELAPRYDLIPFCALKREAVRMAEGAKDHGAKNYQRGAGDASFALDRMNHLLDHAIRYASGNRDTDHLAAIRCNAAILMWLDENG